VCHFCALNERTLCGPPSDQSGKNLTTAVMTMIGGALVAIIQMLKGITDTQEKQEKPEYKLLHEMLNRVAEKEPPMRVDVENGKVIVSKGHDTVTMKENDHA